MFAGLFCFDAHGNPLQHATPESLSAALAPYHRPDREGIWQDQGALLLAQRTFNATASQDETLPLRCPESGVALAFWGRLDNRDELATRLRLTPEQMSRLLDSELALAAWRRWGDDLPQQLLGDFAIAILDPRRRRLLLARDALGVKPLYYRHDAPLFAFASSAAALRVLRGLPLTPDRRWMAEYMLGLSMSQERTGYAEIRKLPPGHSLILEAGAAPTLRRWQHWRDDSPDASRRDPRWVDEYRSLLDEAIRCRMSSAYPLGTENSGGLDSATITTRLARFLGTPGDRLYGFGIALGENEPGCILETSQVAQLKHNYVTTARSAIEPMPDDLIQRSLRVLGYPEEHIIGSSLTPFYREAQLHGVRTLFSGFGGDEVVTNPAVHVPLEMLDAGHYAALREMLPGNALTQSLRMLRLLYRRNRRVEHNAAFLAAWRQRWPHQFLRREVIAEYDLEAAYFATAVRDAPYRRSNDFILQHLLRQPYIAQRFEASTLTAASWGIEYRWPLWDVRLVQQYLSTPSIEKRGPAGMGRYLHRRAVNGMVPDRITWQPSKDMGIGKVVQGLMADRIKALPGDLHAILDSMPPALAELVDAARLRQLARQEITAPDQDQWVMLESNLLALRWLGAWLKPLA